MVESGDERVAIVIDTVITAETIVVDTFQDSFCGIFVVTLKECPQKILRNRKGGGARITGTISERACKCYIVSWYLKLSNQFSRE